MGRLYDCFYAVEAASQSPGLGMTIARTLAQSSWAEGFLRNTKGQAEGLRQFAEKQYVGRGDSMKTIYVVEDDANIREIEMFALKNSGYEAIGFECARDFLECIQDRKASLILLDIMLPDEDGISLLKKLRERPDTRDLPIILVTAKTTEIDKVKGLDMGADDYITKPFGVMELISRVKALLRRAEPKKEADSLTLSDIVLSKANRSCQVAGEKVELTYKEFELLSLLMQNAGIVLTRDALMEKIWGIDFLGESRTLDVHIKTLRKKLGEAGKHIKTVRNVGYLLQ